MATLRVTFSRIAPGGLPLADGEIAASEELDIGGSSDVTSATSSVHDSVVELEPDTDCWVIMGTNPTAVVGQGRFIQANDSREFYLRAGRKVAVIADS